MGGSYSTSRSLGHSGCSWKGKKKDCISPLYQIKSPRPDFKWSIYCPILKSHWIKKNKKQKKQRIYGTTEMTDRRSWTWVQATFMRWWRALIRRERHRNDRVNNHAGAWSCGIRSRGVSTTRSAGLCRVGSMQRLNGFLQTDEIIPWGFFLLFFFKVVGRCSIEVGLFWVH